MRHGKTNEVYCDYVFGRMMKWRGSWEDNVVILNDRGREFTPDYQSFCRTYPDNRSLVQAAMDSLNIKATILEDENV
jgi:hypothetical protein